MDPIWGKRRRSTKERGIPPRNFLECLSGHCHPVWKRPNDAENLIIGTVVMAFNGTIHFTKSKSQNANHLVPKKAILYWSTSHKFMVVSQQKVRRKR
jgi:hypothetical protein